MVSYGCPRAPLIFHDWFKTIDTPPQFISSPLKNGGWKTISLSYWVSVTFQGWCMLNFGGVRFFLELITPWKLTWNLKNHKNSPKIEIRQNSPEPKKTRWLWVPASRSCSREILKELCYPPFGQPQLHQGGRCWPCLPWSPWWSKLNPQTTGVVPT